ncbi:MAG: hypothetical protein K9G38_04885 [Bacteroidales bacterium]|nr:hypothetical protein [Bacteroidales bacterium]
MKINPACRHFLSLLMVTILIAGCEKEIIINPETNNTLPADTTSKNTDNGNPVYDSTGHALLYVITPDNEWGGQVITEVDRVMSLLKTTRYTLTNYITDVENGRLELDCSKYVETILKEVSLFHYEQLPKSSKSGKTSLAKDYYNYFVTLPEEPDGLHCWIRIPSLAEARPGDMISYIHEEQGSTTGHVMIICSVPEPSEFNPVEMSVVINDAANSGHFEDCRNGEGIYADDYSYISEMYFENGIFKFSGVGIGTMWFYMGNNSYYRWRSASGPKVYKNIAIGRLVEIPTTSIRPY